MIDAQLDRFIPNRSAMDFDFAHHVITEAAGGKKAEEAAVLISASKDAYRKGLAEALNLNRTRILPFRNKPPPLHHYSSPPPPLHLSCRKELDAPGILDDFCLNLLDWGSLAWNNNILLTTGGMDGKIVNSDVRIRPVVATYRGHSGEVCGLKWSASGKQLASGGSDNVVHVWDAARSSTTTTQWLHRLEEHTYAVKALAWCPFQSSLLATGGGGGDGSIKFWNTHTGACLNSVHAGSQVCALFWSKKERELLSSHGNHLALKIAELTGKFNQRYLDICVDCKAFMEKFKEVAEFEEEKEETKEASDTAGLLEKLTVEEKNTEEEKEEKPVEKVASADARRESC
ncbi:LOW QUALITY PROTEIN: hypothetical protein HID58_075127 [Brassica napus]|uniref:Anaphase-promoting complex subunit 4 WD40 domain-containing protein n=2 Tax=Brassica TaxID=3705 RepID=A0ABQ7YIT9_BRANA|nr:LOW QUALITY PROTEIN: hypothetical protein HID58_075127 [Brassica napus]